MSKIQMINRKLNTNDVSSLYSLFVAWWLLVFLQLFFLSLLSRTVVSVCMNISISFQKCSISILNNCHIVDFDFWLNTCKYYNENTTITRSLFKLRGEIQRSTKYKKYIDEILKCSSYKPQITNRILTNLGTKHPGVKAMQDCSNERPCLFLRGDNSEKAKIHWQKILTDYNQTWHKAFFVFGEIVSSLFKWRAMSFSI